MTPSKETPKRKSENESVSKKYTPKFLLKVASESNGLLDIVRGLKNEESENENEDFDSKKDALSSLVDEASLKTFEELKTNENRKAAKK